MMRALGNALLLAGFASGLAAQTTSPAQNPTQQQAAAGPYSISGTVLGATTGTPLDRAEVTLSTAGQQSTQLATVTTTDTGVFRFDHLAAGKYTLDASRRGYIAAGYQEHEGFVTAIVTGPDLDGQDLRLPLFPEGVLSGAVTDDSGDPVGGAQVSLYRQLQENGISHIATANSAVTDDTGTYEFSRLRPGDYYISVAATPWYGFHPRPRTDGSGNPLPSDEQPHSPLDVAYSTTFYPNATDSASAAPITINAGDRVQANVSLHAVPAVHIRIQIPAPVPGRSFAMPQLRTEAFGTEHFQPTPIFQATQTSVDGQRGTMTVEIGGIAPGHYDLGEFGPQGELRGGSVDLTTSQTLEFKPAAGATDVSGRLAMASGRKLAEGLDAILVPSGNQGRPIGARVSADGTFDFPSVASGSYEFQVHAFSRSIAVAQMAASAGQVEGSHITVGTDPVLLAATLVTGSVTVNGYAQSDGKGIGGVMILLIPRQPGASHELYPRDQSDSDGSFALSRVIPGDYTLVAIENGWTLDWGRPEVMAAYLAHGLAVHVPDQQGPLSIPAPVAVQPR
ncbi:MAG: carboxypeptidase-like regulatory domain-containing protein [Acidobacteriaceae bacterium]